MHIRCTECLTSRKFQYPELRKFNEKLSTLDLHIVWICIKFEYPEFHIFKGKLCTLDVQMARIVKNFIIKN